MLLLLPALSAVERERERREKRERERGSLSFDCGASDVAYHVPKGSDDDGERKLSWKEEFPSCVNFRQAAIAAAVGLGIRLLIPCPEGLSMMVRSCAVFRLHCWEPVRYLVT